jgi:hypothetical protein
MPNDVGPLIAEWLRGQRLSERERVNGFGVTVQL